jgi:beta-mannosidase
MLLKNKLLGAFSVLLVFSCIPEKGGDQNSLAQSYWEFRDVSSDQWYSAKVPGEVHSDLINNSLIKDPFIGNNERDLQWISETNWEYRTTFNVDKASLNKEHIQLTFNGLDTYADVFLNETLILKANNAFRIYNLDIKPYVKVKNNLRILFHKPSSVEEIKKAELNYELPEGNRIFTRKAQFQYGWDWGPKMNTSGIWKTIELNAWNGLNIDDTYIKLNNLTDRQAALELDLELKGTSKDNYQLELYVNDVLNATQTISNNQNSVKIPFNIDNPKLWWPHNIGDPYLYDIELKLKLNETVVDSKRRKHGLRTIELITDEDSLGSTFYFKVNGEPIYMKGANYIPQHSFQNQVTKQDYQHLLDDALEANMNMLRIWGGGIYEDDIFYELCDEKGIMVWQDFMFACAMYPGDEEYLNNVTLEAIDNVKRLRNYASIVLWCGNNEISEGWHRWGWQDGRSEEEKAEIWSNYLKIFDSILPNTVAELSGDVPYWESSPKFGRGNPKYEFEGDAHDWWIWHDAYPFEHLEEHIPRFMSEFGMQSFPSYEAIKFINQKDSIIIDTEDFISHQKHHRGFQLIEEYMSRDFPIPTEAEDYIYMSQLVQAHGITLGLEAQRRNRPYNMGTLYWQLNDCWPSVSWSSIDYFGNWKALHYKTKKSFDNLLISSYIQNGQIEIYVVNDDLANKTLNLEFEIIDFKGNSKWWKSSNVEASANSSSIIDKIDLNEIGIDSNSHILVLKSEEETWIDYLAKPKDLKLQKSEITRNIVKTDFGFNIELSSSTLQKDVFLYTNSKGHFSDNYIDLLPNEMVVVSFNTDSEILKDLKIKTLNQFLN